MCSPSLLGHGDFRHLPSKWEPRLLVVKQNFLFEYLPGEPKRPIGFLHLQVSTASSSHPKIGRETYAHPPAFMCPHHKARSVRVMHVATCMQGSSASARLDHKNVLHLVTLAEIGSTSSSSSSTGGLSPPTSMMGSSSSPHQTTLLQAGSSAQAHR